MTSRIVGLIGALALAVLALAVPFRSAHAVADMNIAVRGDPQAIGETTIQLVDQSTGQTVQEDRDSDRRAGIWWFRGKKPGAYQVRVLRGGKVVEQETVRIPETGSVALNVDALTGRISMARAATTIMRPRFDLGVFGGAKRTPWDGRADYITNALSDSGDLDDTIGEFGIEGRYHFGLAQNTRQFELGRGMFVYGSALHYFGGPLTRLFANFHPTPGFDSGMSVEERWAFRLGLGYGLNIYQSLGLALMVGAHTTQVEVEGITDESGGGGTLNRFSRTKWLLGPFFAAELNYPLGFMQAVAAYMFLRAEFSYMPDVTVSGRSTSGFDYRYEAEGGINSGVVAGLRFAF